MRLYTPGASKLFRLFSHKRHKNFSHKEAQKKIIDIFLLL